MDFDGKVRKTLNWAKKNQKSEIDKREASAINLTRERAYILRRLGWTIEEVAQALSVSVTSVKRWDKKLREVCGDLPATRLAKDTMQTLIPLAMKVAEESLRSDDERIAWDAAKTVLNAFEVMVTKTQGVTELTDDELIAEAERIIASCRGVVSAPECVGGVEQAQTGGEEPVL